MTQDPNQPAYPGGDSYPAGGGYPSPGDTVRGPVTPPPPVSLAVKLMYAGAVLSLISGVSSFLVTDSIREQVEAQAGMDSAAVDAAVTFALIFGVLVGLIGVGLWILNAVFNARGKSWARILSTVLGGLAIAFGLLGFLQPQAGLTLVLGVVQMLLAVGIIVLLWRPESSRFYAAASAPRY